MLTENVNGKKQNNGFILVKFLFDTVWSKDYLNQFKPIKIRNDQIWVLKS